MLQMLVSGKRKERKNCVTKRFYLHSLLFFYWFYNFYVKHMQIDDYNLN